MTNKKRYWLIQLNLNSELLYDSDSNDNGLMRSFQHRFFTKNRKKGRSIGYSYIASKISEYEWLYVPSVSMLRLAAQLASDGHLKSVEEMELLDMDISDIPPDPFGKLVSKVTDLVSIYLLTPTTHLDIIMENAQCRRLDLSCMDLTELQTRAMVRAMQDRVIGVKLSGVTLDIEVLCQYNGQGKCWMLKLEANTRTLHGERILSWMEEVGWSVLTDTDWELTVHNNNRLKV